MKKTIAFLVLGLYAIAHGACGGDDAAPSWTELDTDTGPEMVWVHIDGGTFEMGNSFDDSEETANERPVHTVTVPSFEITKTEVTVGQYRGCVDDSACTEAETEAGISMPCNWGLVGRGAYPLNCLDWNQTVQFCKWAGGRLPTEAEWEFAARSRGKDIMYPWGNEIATCEYAVIDEGTGSGCGEERTWPVCSKPKGNTQQGLCDMAGNLFEWVQDWHHESYEGAPTDGSAWVEPTGAFRATRGGSLKYGEFWARSTSRNPHGDPSFKVFTIGFRCAK